MSELPIGWDEVLLDEVAQWGSGGTPSRSNPEFYNGIIPWIKTGELGSGVITETVETLSEVGLRNSSAKIFPKGAVAVAMYGATIGKTSILGIDAATNQACAVGVPTVGVTSTEYLYYYVKSQKDAFIEAGKGGAQPNISQGVIKSWPIPLAPLNEQKRIAEKLDALLRRVGTCREKLDRVPLILKRFRQAVLAAATSGALTEDWRNLNTIAGHNIPSELSSERAKKWGGRGKYKPAVTANEVDATEFSLLPDPWHRGTLDQITWSVKDGPHFSPKYTENGVPFISGGSIKPGKIDLSIAKFISPKLHQELSVRCKPELFDILYTKGGTTGLAAVNTLKNDFNVWVHVAVLKLVSGNLVTPLFVQHALNSPECYAQSQRHTHGVGNQDLGLTRMIKIVLPIPPIEEQLEIVRRVEKLMTFADRLKASYTTARKRVDQLTPSLLAKAFRGELVEQDPNDEPASVLLERIKAERAGQVTAKQTRGRKRKAAEC